MTKLQIHKPENLKLDVIIKPFHEFAKIEASGGLLLLASALIALILANSIFAEQYFAIWHSTFSINLGPLSLSMPVEAWINEGLMALFFLVVGLEIKREFLVGELSSAKKALLPVVAAVGGMMIPAIIYTAFNLGNPGASGWGIPMATDIAFTVGVLTLLGKRIPTPLKAFIVALAIVDDIGAVLVIALFYTTGVSVSSLGAAVIILLALFFANRLKVRSTLVYAILGIFLWFAFLKSGVHATVAGVLLALLIPSKPDIDMEDFHSNAQGILNRLDESDKKTDVLSNREHQGSILSMEVLTTHAETPMQRMERFLHPWVTFMIVPLFALANAGIPLGNFSTAVTSTVSMGVIFGLIAGKQIGITLFTWIAIKTNLSIMPRKVSWRQIYGVSWLAGIGFTMSIFITNLSLASPALAVQSKMGILLASLIGGIVGYLILRTTSASPDKP